MHPLVPISGCTVARNSRYVCPVLVFLFAGEIGSLLHISYSLFRWSLVKIILALPLVVGPCDLHPRLVPYIVAVKNPRQKKAPRSSGAKGMRMRGLRVGQSPHAHLGDCLYYRVRLSCSVSSSATRSASTPSNFASHVNICSTLLLLLSWENKIKKRCPIARCKRRNRTHLSARGYVNSL